MPTVSAPDWRTHLLSVAAVKAIIVSHGVHARNPAFQQRFQGSRRVGMVSG